ncbi:hypothetical protein L226DRAFT_573933 [Lentinus tigrinus ALCF2SS1-7]|uniref:uncharacterized protein n=1 Tax=Lentinus tigrinus ALCF2SS1-7 TaxID=1328758 RepID=UPI0011660A25|nr:hypothetical protein L226DRAFT_573933 [Lentinus tigrinus ALCF2SS1-7]
MENKSDRNAVDVVFSADAVLVVEAVLASLLFPSPDALALADIVGPPIVSLEDAAELLLTDVAAAVPLPVLVDAVADCSDPLSEDADRDDDDDTADITVDDTSEAEPGDALGEKDVMPPMVDTADSLADVGEEDIAVVLVPPEVADLEDWLVVLESRGRSGTD